MAAVGRSRAAAGALALGLVASVVAMVGVPRAAAEPVSRPEDPVVVTGRTLTPLLGVAPDRVAAFRREAGAWVPIPVQVDERALVDFGSEPSANGVPGSTGTVYGTQAIGVAVLQYTDPETWVGPDPNPAVDRNDEVALMARDAGDQALGAEPPEHVDAATGLELSITDPLEPGAQSWVYLFAHDGTLDPSAGQHLVDYDFSLASGDYKATYLRAEGPNPEDSTVTTAAYAHHFSDRWVDDELHVTVGDATGVDILDRHRNQFAPFECGRSEDTFSDGEGAFVVNRVGPVRAIRSYVGANSGPLSQRTHLFYEARHEILSDLRVHPIPGMMEIFDYSPAAAGMTYRNSAMGADVTIDGVPDVVSTARSFWEMVRGAQGSLISVRHADHRPGPPQLGLQHVLPRRCHPAGRHVHGRHRGLRRQRAPTGRLDRQHRSPVRPVQPLPGPARPHVPGPGSDRGRRPHRPPAGRGPAGRHRSAALRLPAPPVRRRRRPGLDLPRPRLGGPPRAGHGLRGRGVPPRRGGPPGCGGQHALA